MLGEHVVFFSYKGRFSSSSHRANRVKQTGVTGKSSDNKQRRGLLVTLKLGADQQEEKYGETTPGFLRFCPLYKQYTAEKR